MDILLNSNTHDVVFTNGVGQETTQELRQTVGQRLKVSLLTYQGEWFLDEDLGVPYYQEILGRPRSKQVIDTIFQKTILDDPDVISLLEFESELDSERLYTMRFKVNVTGDITETIILNLGV